MPLMAPDHVPTMTLMAPDHVPTMPLMIVLESGKMGRLYDPGTLG
jgi:hypothetical protein